MTQRSTPVKRLTKKQRLSELQGLVELCFGMLVEQTHSDSKEICNLTGLSMSTINRLSIGNFTLAVRYGTIQALAGAAGLHVELTSDNSVHVSLVD